MLIEENIAQAVDHLLKGHVIAYPTEAVFGLGCDPFNEQAVRRIDELKGRPKNKNFILIAASWDQINFLIKPLSRKQLEPIKKSWPGPHTWVFPASDAVPSWILGQNETIALRITNHPLARQLCQKFNKAIVSTSANLSGQAPAKNSSEVKKYFSNKIDFILEGDVGECRSPTPIRDARTGLYLRR